MMDSLALIHLPLTDFSHCMIMKRELAHSLIFEREFWDRAKIVIRIWAVSGDADRSKCAFWWAIVALNSRIICKLKMISKHIPLHACTCPCFIF